MLSPGLYYVPGSLANFPKSSQSTQNGRSGLHREASDKLLGRQGSQITPVLHHRTESIDQCKDQTCDGPALNITYCGIPSRRRRVSDQTSAKKFMCRLCWPDKNHMLIEKHCRGVSDREVISLYTLLGLATIILVLAAAGMIYRHYRNRRNSRAIDCIRSDT